MKARLGLQVAKRRAPWRLAASPKAEWLMYQKFVGAPYHTLFTCQIWAKLVILVPQLWKHFLLPVPVSIRTFTVGYK